MSLLLDALKKAEEAKRQATANSGGQSVTDATLGTELSLEPVNGKQAAGVAPPHSVSGSPLPDLSDHLDTVDADLAAVTTSPPLRHTPTETGSAAHGAKPRVSNLAAEQAAVRNVFATKRTPVPNRSSLWIALGLAGLAAIGVGGWLFWQIQSIGNSSAVTRPTQPTINPPAAPPAPQTVEALLPPVANPQLLESTPATYSKAATQLTPPERNERLTKSASGSESPVRITRGELKVSPTLNRAYEQLEAGDLPNAAHAYGQVLDDDPNNIDALIGMAAVSARKGDSRTAEGWYLRALESDPKNIDAYAGIINLHGQAEPQTAESNLKGLLATKPESPALNFALGNLYAGQRRWPEAQLAYFSAHTADPGNPDYLFNLAASLDQMHLPKIALDYYKAALVASNSRRAAFNAEQVKVRIAELQP